MACIVAIVSVMLQHLQPLKLVNINKKIFFDISIEAFFLAEASC